MTNMNPDPSNMSDDSEERSCEPCDPSKDRFVEALLTHRFAETAESMDARINRVHRAVHAQSTLSKSNRMRTWQWWALPIAALLAVSLLVMPTASSASAIVRSATKVASNSADRQYQVILNPKPRRAGDEPPPILATLDVRDAEHMRIEIHYPDGRIATRGRDGAISWEIRPDGSSFTSDRTTPWPRWIETPDGSLLVDSMASMLEELDDSFEVEKVTDAESCASTELLQIRATRRTNREIESTADAEPSRRNPAERIEMCIDSKSSEVIRLEMFFPAGDPPIRDRSHESPPNGERGPPPGRAERHAPPPPLSISFSRTALTAFPADWFEAPSVAAPDRSQQ